MTDSQPQFSWGSIVLPAYLPTLLFSLGEGAIIPVIPVVASERGASIALAGLVAAMLMIGELLGDLPAGWLVARIGERNAMIGAAMLAVIGVVVALALPSVTALAIGILLLGLATAVFGLARHAFLTSYVPARVRARALSTLAGVFRAGWAVGPFVAAAIIAWTGSSEPVFWVLVAACLAVVVVLVLLPDPERVFGVGRGAATGTGEEAPQGVLRAIVEHRGVLARVGSGIGLLAAVRASRTIILPLWAVSIGMPPEAAALVIGISATIDFCLFYVSGQVMDRFGRLWGAIPGLVGLSTGHLILAFTHDVPGNGAWFIAVAVLFGVANGVSSGVILTVGADLAPKRHPAAFLGAYRTIGDAGQAAAPLVVSAVTSLVSLAAASAAIGVLGFVGAGMLLRWIPRYVPGRRGRRRGEGEGPAEGTG
ncbi:MFS transporter [Agromyces sp. NBRC 114283]|uniref:MFS transporter n=1 Tax=Agromyces sp. NBRC 114283 TaxID=2994521 RepID=UPI0024A445A4|nr:MFS transporter [Agromyces sp. NBRC 114283]GLU89620.1 MFS transporter [Agromyces sp. NBRC 114283]